MEEIKIGEYVRTEEGYIGKIYNENNQSYLLYRIVCKEIEGCETIRDYCFWKDEIEKYNITKHSFNIIDLIEEGDYVNGDKIIEKFYDYANNYFHIITEGNKHLFKEDIKSIVTKEQFKAMEYEVK